MGNSPPRHHTGWEHNITLDFRGICFQSVTPLPVSCELGLDLLLEKTTLEIYAMHYLKKIT